MKKLTFTIILTLAFVLPIFAQDDNCRDTARNLYYAGKQKPAARPGPKPSVGRIGTMVRIEMKDAETSPARWVPYTTGFRSGNWIRLHIQINRPGYLTVFNQGTRGDLQLIYPKSEKDAQSMVYPTTDFTVPTSAKKWLQFDEVPGTERMVIMLSSQPVPEVLAHLSGDSRLAGSIDTDAFRTQVEDSTSRDFTEVEESKTDDGQPAVFFVPSCGNAGLRRPIVHKISLRHFR